MKRSYFSSLRFPAKLLVLLALVFLAWPALAGCYGGGPGAALPASSPEPPLRIAGTRKALPVLQKLAEAYQRAQPSASFRFDLDIESIPAIREVGAGTLDLALSSSQLPSDAAATSVVARPFVRDAIAFATNASVTLPGLSSAQVRAVYSGQVTAWEQLGGAAGPIMVLDREESDTSHQQVLLKLLGGTPIQGRTIVLTSSKDMLDALETTAGTIGYSALGLLQQRQASSVRVLSLDGVTPSPQTLTGGAYPWHMTFYLVHRTDLSPALRRFLDFAWGPDGRSVIEEYGYGAATG